MASSDRAYNLDDVIPVGTERPVSYRGKPTRRYGTPCVVPGQAYASPFYGESSFLMYRKDVLQDADIEMPANPHLETRRGHRPEDRHARYSRDLPPREAGWGELGASFTTALNTFGGTWWSAKPDGSVDKARVDKPQFRRALAFHVDLVKDAGESHAGRASYNQCLEQYRSGKIATWYDATVAASNLEADDSPAKGKTGYVPAPVERTRASGWRWSWALAVSDIIEQSGPRLEVHRVGDRAAVPEEAGTRISGRLGGDPTGHARIDRRDTRVQAGRRRVRAADPRRDRVRADR
jgi:sorbitol/mannitol transport system substrate-binding protein